MDQEAARLPSRRALWPWALALLLFSAATVLWYLSPYLALRGMHEAAVQRDAAAFNAWVDYPRLRDSAKDEWIRDLSSAIADAISHQRDLPAAVAHLAHRTQ